MLRGFAHFPEIISLLDFRVVWPYKMSESSDTWHMTASALIAKLIDGFDLIVV